MKWGRGGYFPKRGASKDFKKGASLLFLFGIISFWLIWSNLGVSKSNVVLVQNNLEKKESIKKTSSKDNRAIKTDVIMKDLSQSDPFVPAPNLNIVKTAILNDEVIADGNAQAGETVEYTYTVTNTGNVALDKISVLDGYSTESKLPEVEIALSAKSKLTTDKKLDGVWDTIGPGDSIQFIYEFTVTE